MIEQIPPELIQIASSVPSLFVVYLIIDKVVSGMKAKNSNGGNGSGNGKNKDMEIEALKKDVERIENNHLKHIQDSLDKNNEDHKRIEVAIGKLETKIDDLRR